MVYLLVFLMNCLIIFNQNHMQSNKSSNNQITGASIVFEVLSYFNVKNVFGYPGGCAIPLYDELALRLKNGDKNIKHFLTAHEQGAVHSAEGYAKSSGNVGVVFTTSGPGATNTITGLADAFADSVPLVVITCNVSSGLIGTNAFQEVNICDISKSVVKKNVFVNKVEDIQKTLYEAFNVATSGRKAPVLVDITKDALSNRCVLEDFSSFVFND